MHLSYFRTRMVSQYGKNHESLSLKRCFHVILHDLQKNHGIEPQSPNRHLIEKEIRLCLKWQNHKRLGLVDVRNCLINLRILSWWTHILRQQNSQNDQIRSLYWWRWIIRRRRNANIGQRRWRTRTQQNGRCRLIIFI